MHHSDLTADGSIVTVPLPCHQLLSLLPAPCLATHRYWQLAFNWTLVQPCDLTADGSVVTLRLRWPSGSRVVPGQTLYLRVPKLSWFQTHPFSVAGVEEVAPADPNSPPVVYVALHMKVAGSWTKGMCGLAWAGQPIWVQVEGPYNTCLEPVPSGPAVVMIAGGIGVSMGWSAACVHACIHAYICMHVCTEERGRGGVQEEEGTRGRVEGPYDTCLEPLPSGPAVVMIAGGIGVSHSLLQ